jgi:hypothetical protein
MLWMLAIKNILISIYQKIGFWGCVVILALAGMYFQHLEIQHQKSIIFDDNNRIASLVVDVKKQNSAIDEVNAQVKILQDALNKTMLNNSVLSDKVAGYKVLLNKEPIPNTCDESMNELSIVAKKTADAWNTGVLP